MRGTSCVWCAYHCNPAPSRSLAPCSMSRLRSQGWLPRALGHSPVASLSPQEAIQLDGEILFSLLQKVSPVAHKHLSQQKIDPLLYMTEWFMCAFSRTLPWSSVLRVWDMFFCEGTGLGSGQHPCHQSSSRGGPLFAEKLPRAAPTTRIYCLPPCRSQDHLPGGLGAAEAGAGLPREGPRLPRPVRDHRAAAEPQPQGHAGGVPGPGGTATPAPHPRREGETEGLVGACGLVLSSPRRHGQTSSFCLNKERGTERPRSP